MAPRKSPVAFVLSGGAGLGAINGAFVAARPQTVETAEALGGIWRHVRRAQVFPFNPVTGQELLLSSGPLLEAVMASASIPSVLPPVRWGDRALMDGGVANNTPISHAIELGAREIYVLPTGHACALEHAPTSALGMALHALSLLTHSRLIADIELHRDDARLIVMPPPCPLAIAPIDFGHANELIARAVGDARAFLDEGGAARPPIRMRMHRHAHADVRTPASAALTGQGAPMSSGRGPSVPSV